MPAHKCNQTLFIKSLHECVDTWLVFREIFHGLGFGDVSVHVIVSPLRCYHPGILDSVVALRTITTYSFYKPYEEILLFLTVHGTVHELIQCINTFNISSTPLIYFDNLILLPV